MRKAKDNRELTLRSAHVVRQIERQDGIEISLSYRGNELAGEVGEACNILKKIERERIGMRGSRATPADLADELADIVICVDLIAAEFNINLDDAIRNKFNATSDKYGLRTRLR